MPDGQETSLEELRKLIEENEKSLRQAKRLLEWLEAHAANESIRRTLEVSKEELQRQVQKMPTTDPPPGGERDRV